MDVSVIIVNCNTRILLDRCLRSIYEQTRGVRFEVIVVDNGSTDGSVEMVRHHFPGVTVLEMGGNLGFGKANNRALARAAGRYVLYLNSDTVLLNNAVGIFKEYWESRAAGDSLGALGCNLLDEDMLPIHSSGSFPTVYSCLHDVLKIVFQLYRNTVERLFGRRAKPTDRKPPARRVHGEVDYVTGADLFMKNDEYARFDERYFLYYEDADLERRLHEARKKRLIIEGPVIQHLTGGSNPERDEIAMLSSFSFIQASIAAVKYLKKHSPGSPGIAILKAFTLMIFVNPFLFQRARRYILDVIRA